MKKTNKRGFTIVELVIVIAVIAILAAVLIPTFSSIIKKANLSADKQAVREMNMALAEYEASSGYSVIPDVDAVMQVLANAGYNTENWQCLTAGYEVYWFKNDNRMVLYNAADAAIEYPDEYVGSKIMVSPENGFFIYNYNHVQAQNFNTSVIVSTDASGKVKGSTNFTSVATSSTAAAGLNSNQDANIGIMTSMVSNTAVKNAIASTEKKASAGSNIYMYGTREEVSSQAPAYASMQIAAVGTEENPVKLKSNGEVQENLFVISVKTGENATPTQIQQAKEDAGRFVYTVFDQISTGKINPGASIILEEGTELDVSASEWAPCKTFCGYFGTTNADKPIVIDGARLTSATGYSQTVAMTGSNSKYFITGFFGTIYGNTTIENVVFKGLNINAPANDYELTESDRNANKINTRNTVAVIGGVTDGFEEGKQTAIKANVTLKNIVVENTCSITGAGCAGGLVGYVGSLNGNPVDKATLKGNINIENCQVHADVTSIDKNSGEAYKSVGGIIGFTCRVDKDTIIKIDGCKVDSKITSDSNAGAVCGAFQNSPTVTINGGDYSGATVSGVRRSASVAGYIDATNGDIRFGSTAPVLSALPHTFKVKDNVEWVFSTDAPAVKA